MSTFEHIDYIALAFIYLHTISKVCYTDKYDDD